MPLKPELLRSIAENDPSLIAVDISQASVNDEDIQSLEWALTTNRTLASIKLPDNAVVAAHSATLAEAILKSGNKNIYSIEPKTISQNEWEPENTAKRSLAGRCNFNAGLARYYMNQLSSNQTLGQSAFPDVADMIPLMVALVENAHPGEKSHRISALLAAVKTCAAHESVKLKIVCHKLDPKEARQVHPGKKVLDKE